MTDSRSGGRFLAVLFSSVSTSWRWLKLHLWDMRGFAFRIVFVVALISVFAGTGGLAFAGIAIAVPLVIVFTACAALVAVILDEFRKVGKRWLKLRGRKAP